MYKRFSLGIILFIVFIISLFLFYNFSTNKTQVEVMEKGSGEKSIITPKTYQGSIADLIPEVSELPEGYTREIKSPRLKSEMRKESIDNGWIEGYKASYKKGENIFTTMGVQIYISRYPLENISKIIEPPKDYEDNETKILYEEIPITELGDNSYSFKGTEIQKDGFLEDTVIESYEIEFTKKDIYVALRVAGLQGADYEVIKDLAGKIADKI